MIDVEGLSLTYHTSGESHLAVNDISFRVEEGQFYTLLGPSGCGKTTTLRCVAGLERPDRGTLRVDGMSVSSSETGDWVPPNRRAIGMVFQSYAIWPHMTVFENVAFPLRYGEARVPRRDVQGRVHKALEMVQLDSYVDRPAPHLSGGQQQRLALARALVMDPKVLLLDEPLSNLDAKLREEMRVELRQLVKAIGMTTIFVTHEQIEALTLSDVIAVMNDGKIVQEGTPLEIYRQPSNPFVANFIGQSNLLPGNVTELNGSAAPDRRVVRVASAVGNLACTAPADIAVGDEIVIAIRPEHVVLQPGEEEAENTLTGTLDSTNFIGNSMDCIIRVGDQPFRVMLHPERTPAVGSSCTLYVAARHCLAMRSDRAQ
jgi:iron(III) transport system ATP-binding protein